MSTENEIKAGRDELHRILREVLVALDNGSGATERASVEFLACVPAEVRGELAARERVGRAEVRKLGAVVSAARTFREADTGGSFNDLVVYGKALDAALAKLDGPPKETP